MSVLSNQTGRAHRGVDGRGEQMPGEPYGGRTMPKDLALVSGRRFGAPEAAEARADRLRRPGASPMVSGDRRPDASPVAVAPVPSERGVGAEGARAAYSGSEIRILRFEGFRLDTVNQCLWRDGARIELTPKAFAVLRYLVEHADRLVMQQELLEALWPETYVQPEILKTYIRDIRKILGDDPRAPRFIETRARRGYRFIAVVGDESSLASAAPPVSPPRTPVGQESDLNLLSDVLLPTLRDARKDVLVTPEAGTDRTTLVEALQQQALTQALLWMAVSQSLPARFGHVQGQGGPTRRSALDERQDGRMFIAGAEGHRHEVRGVTTRRSLSRPDDVAGRDGRDTAQHRPRRVELVWRGGRPAGEGRPPV